MVRDAIKTLGILLIVLNLCRIDIYAYGLEYIIPQNGPKSAMPLHTEWYDIGRIVYASADGRVCFDGKSYTYIQDDTTAKNECGIQLDGFNISFEKVDSIITCLSTRTSGDSIRLSPNEMELLTFFVTIADLPRLMFPHYDRTRTDYKMPISDIAVYLGRSTYRSPVLDKGQGRILQQWYDCNKQYISEEMWRQYLEYVFGTYPARMIKEDWLFDTSSPICACMEEVSADSYLELLQRIVSEYAAAKYAHD